MYLQIIDVYWVCISLREQELWFAKFYTMSLLKNFVLILFLFVIGCNKENNIDWISWKKAATSIPFKTKGVVWLYTDWCTTSEFVEENVLKDQEIIDYINSHFYAIKFNGESKETINAAGRDWNFVEESNSVNDLSIGYHTLALALTDLDPDRFNKNVPYPRLIFMDEELNRIVPVDGNLTKEELLTLLEFVALEKYKLMTIDEYMQQKAIQKFKEVK